MAQFTVGCVPYVNAVPLVWWFESLGEKSPVRVVYDVPSKLPRLLESGEVQAILVSSVDSILSTGRQVADGVCIGSHGPVESVRLFSKVPFDQITHLALDASSLTSNRLAQLVLEKSYGVIPETTIFPPDPAVMLAQNDACVLIGDIGMETVLTDVHVLDLGQAWTDLTGLPFVWAVWTGDHNLSSALASLLAEAPDHCFDANGLLPKVNDYTVQKSGWKRETVDHYLGQVMRFPLDSLAKEGFARFADLLVGGHSSLPAFVHPAHHTHPAS